MDVSEEAKVAAKKQAVLGPDQIFEMGWFSKVKVLRMHGCQRKSVPGPAVM